MKSVMSAIGPRKVRKRDVERQQDPVVAQRGDAIGLGAEAGLVARNELAVARIGHRGVPCPRAARARPARCFPRPTVRCQGSAD